MIKSISEYSGKFFEYLDIKLLKQFGNQDYQYTLSKDGWIVLIFILITVVIIIREKR